MIVTSRKQSSNCPLVGIYFYVDNEVIIDSVPVKSGEQNGDIAIEHGEHYSFWETLVPSTLPERQLKARSYDAYPRGRVVYFLKTDKFRLYHDKCIRQNAEIDMIVGKFGLRNTEFDLAHDEHYQCSRCNPFFLD